MELMPAILNRIGMIDIPYVYGGRLIDGCDCWGLVWLVYQDIGIELPKFEEFYDLHPEPTHGSLRSIIKFQRESKLQKTDSLAEYTILLGVSAKGLGFGVWVDGMVVCSRESVGVSRMSWDAWKVNHDRVILFKADQFAD